MKTITPATLYDLIELSDVRISPDGAHVAFVRMSVDRAGNAYHRSIWLKALNGDAPAEPVTGSTKDNAPRWSPDGRLAFLSGRGDKPQVFVLPARGEARAVASHANGVGAFEWSPDGKRLAFTASMRADERAAETAATTAEPSATKSAFDSRQEKERKEHDDKERFDPRNVTRVPYRSGTSYIDDRWQQIYVVDVPASFGEPGDATPKRLTDLDVGYAVPTWSHDGAVLYSTVTREPDGARPYAYHDVVRLSASEPSNEIKRLTSAGHSCFEPKTSPDGKWVAFMRMREERLGHHPACLAVIPTDGGEPIDLTASLDRDVQSFVWGHDSEHVYFTLQKDGAVNLWRATVPAAISLDAELRTANIPTTIRGRLIDDLNVSKRLVHALRRVGVRTVGELLTFQEQNGTLQEDTSIILEPLTGGAQDVTWFDVDVNGRVVYVAGTAQDLSALYAREPNGVITTLYAPNTKPLLEHSLGAIEAISYPSDEHTIQGWIVTPPGFDPAKRHPLAVNIHGGPHLQWSPGHPSLFLELQTLAARGYVVFFCNPRGSSGYGEAFTAANWKDWGDGPMHDIMRGVDAVLARGFVDEDRLAVTGGSYGGYMTTWIIAHTDRFRAAVAQRGVYNLLSVRNTSDIPLFFDFEFGASPWEDGVKLWELSPIAHAPNINTPLLIEHSELDYRVPVEQGEQLFQALSVMKKPVEFVRYPREGHELSRSGEPEHRIKRLNRIADWFDRFCQS
jgi:dipeptidyl aminopeptidase/acylaminoacyl peptidase